MTEQDTPTARIDAKIASLGDWRADVLARMRGLIREADPEVTEEVKWVKPSNPSGVPTWEHNGNVCIAYGSEWVAMTSIADKTGCTAETLRR